jgi:activator of 2-hydroxyglutaryl-CoA dehydratase
MAHRIVTMLERVGIEPEFGVTGGIAKNSGVMARLEMETGLKPLPPMYDTQIAGALGGALLAKTILEKSSSSGHPVP